ncbi:response regulator [Pedosphaera parvula]|uniref:Two component transcriptional regulator, LuxR family n=1 Tax=Pedosphaera parvula (strain Ellin514) TaxID=320771 RepID=B9XEY0_PEDPL|nr:response regulator transcription factor [Pedosphaera parvula]EEF61478.1 two component transcriptional regulator, LuxR family [Pedosphaera parvula Ellin514]
MANIKILLADDHTVVRQGLCALLLAEHDIEIVAEAETGRQAVQMANRYLPNIIIMDVAMPLLNGLEATRQITSKLPGAKVLVLSSYGDEDSVQKLTEAGAAGYVIKQTAANDLVTAIREVHKGNAFYSAAISQRLRDQLHARFRNGKSVRNSLTLLTPREAEVLVLIAKGQPNKQMASELGISIKTIEKHRQQVMNKLNIHDIAGLTRYAISKGIIEQTPDLAVA